MTYAQIKEDLGLLSGYTHRDKVPLDCTRCGTLALKNRDYIRFAVIRGQIGIFCTMSCGRKYLYELGLIKDSGVFVRKCGRCALPLPLSEFPNAGRSKMCGPCGRQTPKPKYQECKGFAEKRGYPFELSFGEYMTFWGKPCHYCGDDINTIGLDRVDNVVGYTLGNVIPCCSICNTMKHTDTYGNFIARCIATTTNHRRG